jgi:hypothetical protein
MTIRLIVWIGLCAISLFVALFAGSWGPESFLIEYVPSIPEDRDLSVGDLIILLVLWSPLIYGLMFWRWANRRDRALEASENNDD